MARFRARNSFTQRLCVMAVFALTVLAGTVSLCFGQATRLRTGYAIKGNFVTYGGPDMNLRPQLMPCVGAFAAGVTAASRQPNNPNLVVKSYQAAITQVGVG